MCFAKKFYQVFCVKIVCQVLCSKRAKGQEQAQPGTTFHSWISVTLCKLKIEIPKISKFARKAEVLAEIIHSKLWEDL